MLFNIIVIIHCNIKIFTLSFDERKIKTNKEKKLIKRAIVNRKEFYILMIIKKSLDFRL